MMGIRGYYIIGSALFSVWVAYCYGGLLEGAETAQGAILDIFSILAGVLVAVISIIGDPTMLLPGNWRVGYEHATDMQVKIGNFSHLFSVYILSLILVLITMVFEANNVELFFLHELLAGFSVFGLLLSIPLPYSLMAIQKERMDVEIKERKRRARRTGRDE